MVRQRIIQFFLVTFDKNHKMAEIYGDNNRKKKQKLFVEKDQREREKRIL